MGGFVVVNHKIYRIGRGGDKEEFKNGIVGGIGEGPNEICLGGKQIKNE